MKLLAGNENLREQRVCASSEEIAQDQRALLGGLDASRLNPKRRTCDLGHLPALIVSLPRRHT
jgi:hypothetical protein